MSLQLWLRSSCFNPKLKQYHKFIYSLAYRNFGLKLIRNKVCMRKSSDATFLLKIDLSPDSIYIAFHLSFHYVKEPAQIIKISPSCSMATLFCSYDRLMSVSGTGFSPPVSIGLFSPGCDSCSYRYATLRGSEGQAIFIKHYRLYSRMVLEISQTLSSGRIQVLLWLPTFQ